MRLIHSIDEMCGIISGARHEGKTIGLVPTMGALHAGHLTLVGRARQECDFVVVSVFVNPTQFGPSEDFHKYPRTLESDSRKCESGGVDVVFSPSAGDMYPEGFDTWVDVKGPTDVLEGQSRPGHFRGVATVCAKLFNIVEPDRAYFGTKDYQQLQVIKKMTRDLNMRLEIVPVEIVRERDGLAMSSRNAYLDSREREAALVLSRSLDLARQTFASGEHNAKAIKTRVLNLIAAEPLARVDYVAVVDAETLDSIETIDRPAAVLLAVRIGSTRLIDNTVLD
ncbi:MAG: pantoate--beta-alanine ligase [Armatimonadota bacterium]|nr:pantoate--beta-alanine ligase [bacterium]